MTTEIEAVRNQIASDRGENKLIRGDELPNACFLPTGIFILDLMMLGGFHDGRAALIYGVEGSGKSTLGYMGLAAAQRKYPESHVVLLDFEHMYEKQWFEKCGGDPSRLELIQPEFGEEGIDMAMAFLDAEETSALMVDSVATIVPKKMDDRSVEDYGTGERARLAGLMCNKILTSWSRERARGHRCSVFLINQYRDDIGKMMGDPRKLPGGWQINYFAKTRLQMKNRRKDGENARGMKIPDHNLHTATLTKDKGASLMSGEFKINLNPDHPRGIAIGAVDDLATVGTYAKRMGFITGGGQAWRLTGVERMIDPATPNGKKIYDPLLETDEAIQAYNLKDDDALSAADKWETMLGDWEREERKFRLLVDIEDYLYEHPAEALRLKQLILIDMRTSLNMPPLPPDGYLLDWAEIED